MEVVDGLTLEVDPSTGIAEFKDEQHKDCKTVQPTAAAVNLLQRLPQGSRVTLLISDIDS